MCENVILFYFSSKKKNKIRNYALKFEFWKNVALEKMSTFLNIHPPIYPAGEPEPVKG